MDEQIYLDGTESPEFRESQFLNSILGRLQTVVEEKCGDASLLVYKPTKTYSAVFVANFTAFRLKMRKSQNYIQLPTIFEDLIPSGAPVKKVKAEPKYIRIMVTPEHPVDSYTDFLVQIVGETINRYPKDWDCCSRYEECSNAKMCVHPDKAFSLSCGYRKILNSGRIFYGKNRNID